MNANAGIVGETPGIPSIVFSLTVASVADWEGEMDDRDGVLLSRDTRAEDVVIPYALQRTNSGALC